MGREGRLTDTTTTENCALLGYSETTGCPETSVRNYHYSLSNNPEECSYSTSRRQAEVTVTSTTAYKVLAEKIEFKKTLGSCSSGQEKDAATGLQEMCCNEALWIHPPYGGDRQETAANTVGPRVL